MNNTTLIAIDIAKSVFQLHGVDDKGNCVFKKRVNRNQLMEAVSLHAPCTIAMEACGTAHYWGRTFNSLRCDIKLISPQFVKPFVKSNKNDKNDAEAIAEAAMRPSMNFVSLKTQEQQLVQSLYRHRALLIKNRTALANHIRGLLAEFGIVISLTFKALKTKLIELTDASLHPDLPLLLIELCHDFYEELNQLDTSIATYDKKLKAVVKQKNACKALMALDGVGVVSAAAAWVAIGDNPRVYKNGRQFSASVGLVPRQFSSGNKQILGKISKRGDRYLRQLLIHGARTVVWQAQKKDTPFHQWVNQLVQRRGFNVAVVAIANKNARKIWHTLVDIYEAENRQNEDAQDLAA